MRSGVGTAILYGFVFFIFIINVMLEKSISLYWLPICLVFIYVCYKVWQKIDNFKSYRKANICSHGILWGKSRGLCEICVKELVKQKEIREKELAENQRLQAIKSAANDLQKEELKRLTRTLINKLDFLMSGTPKEFEDVVAAMFKKLGYSVKQTPFSGDHGKDAIATKNGKKFLIECKRYGENKLIGRPALQKFYAAIMEEKAEKGFFITTSDFARTAFEYDYVKSNLIELIDGKKLSNMMLHAFPENSDSKKYCVMCLQCGEKVIFNLDAGETSKTCPNNHLVNNNLRSDLLSLRLVTDKIYCEKCGREMRIIDGRRGKFLGCSGYPKCRSTQSIHQNKEYQIKGKEIQAIQEIRELFNKDKNN